MIGAVERPASSRRSGRSGSAVSSRSTATTSKTSPIRGVRKTPAAEYRHWYQWYFHTERGRAGLAANRGPLCRLLWELWSPELSLHRCRLRADGGVLRQPRFRRCRHPVVPASLRQCAGRPGLRRDRGQARGAAADHRADDRPAWRGRWGRSARWLRGRCTAFHGLLPAPGHSGRRSFPAARGTRSGRRGNQRANPTIDVLERVARVLGVDMADLFAVPDPTSSARSAPLEVDFCGAGDRRMSRCLA